MNNPIVLWQSVMIEDLIKCSGKRQAQECRRHFVSI